MKEQEKLSYEQKIEKINEIVKKLQDHSMELPLDEVASLYEEANRLIQECEAYLEEVEDRIKNVPSTKTEATENDELPF